MKCTYRFRNDLYDVNSQVTALEGDELLVQKTAPALTIF